jgi:23S rRNA (pseudouridine1915-N3)-methyltransferase
MRITLLMVGKTSSTEIKAITADYLKRINHYMKMEEIIVEGTGSKTTDVNKVKDIEGDALLKKINPTDYVILLDDKGKEFSSVQFAQRLEGLFNQGMKNICFVIGGAYGFSEKVYQRANGKISLSRLTFSHQIVRAIFLEQLYRAFTIINNEPYHHE